MTRKNYIDATSVESDAIRAHAEPACKCVQTALRRALALFEKANHSDVPAYAAAMAIITENIGMYDAREQMDVGSARYDICTVNGVAAWISIKRVDESRYVIEVTTATAVDVEVPVMTHFDAMSVFLYRVRRSKRYFNGNSNDRAYAWRRLAFCIECGDTKNAWKKAMPKARLRSRARAKRLLRAA